MKFTVKENFLVNFKPTCLYPTVNDLLPNETVIVDAVTRGVSSKMLFLRISQTQVFSCEYCEVFKNIYFEEVSNHTV